MFDRDREDTNFFLECRQRKTYRQVVYRLLDLLQPGVERRKARTVSLTWRASGNAIFEIAPAAVEILRLVRRARGLRWFGRRLGKFI